MNRVRWSSVALVLLALACAPGEADEPGLVHANVSAMVRRQRATLIRDIAREHGITNGLMVAMLAEEETELAHCANEYRLSCPGPGHADCGGSPTMSGSGDGACELNRGGLGMFQIDDGTEADTVRVHGERVLSLRGNTEVAIERVIDKVRRSRWTTNASTRELAIAWINERRIDDSNWDNYIRTLVRYWNGCPESGTCWSNRYPKYNRAARTLYAELGHDFWYGASPPPPPPDPGGGWLSSPLELPRITSHVSHSRSGGWARYDCATLTRAKHRGTDFGVVLGTAVRAAAAGTVIESVTGCPAQGSLSSTCGGSFGNHVIILHSDRLATLYAHLSPAAGQVRIGASVECGQVIGLSGNSGRTSGPHLHFEVRSNVSASTRAGYIAGTTIDPWGGSCSSQASTLWVGGAPQDACLGGPPADRDDAVLARATHASELGVAAGTDVTQTFTWRNTGTTTWAASDYVMRHAGGAFSDVREVVLPSDLMVRPGDTVALNIEVTAPSAAGLHQGTWRLARIDGEVFGRDAVLQLRVTAEPRACQSATLGRMIESGACVQISYSGCGMASCAWYACTDGAWVCASESDCAGETNPHPNCCLAGTTDGGTCSASACGRAGQTCTGDDACCDGFRCVAGACQDPAMCRIEQNSCASPLECCDGLSCLANTFGSNDKECCVGWAGGYCRNADDCCGEMTCSENHCVKRRAGESCATHWDCEGALLCESGTCR